MNMKQKGFTNIILVVVVIVIVVIAGYFVLIKKSQLIVQQPALSPTQPQSPEQPPTTPAPNVVNATKSQALSAINTAQDQVNELKKLIQSLEASKSSSLKSNDITSFFITTANAQSAIITISQAKQSLTKAEKHLNKARSAYKNGNYNVAVDESRAAQIIGITTHFQLIINNTGNDLKQLYARAERWGSPQNTNPDLASAMQTATIFYEKVAAKMANLDLGNFKINGNPTENVKVEPQIIDLLNSEDKAYGIINSAANLLDLIVNGPPNQNGGPLISPSEQP